MMLVRIVEPIAGRPVVRIRLRPTRVTAQSAVRGTHRHATTCVYPADGVDYRVTTNASLSALADERLDRARPAVHLRAGPRRDASRRPRSAAGAVASSRRPRSYWQDWVRSAGDPVRLAGGGDPRGDHAQALHLRGHRRGARGAHDVDPGGAGQRPQLGLPLLLAARQLLRDPGAQPPRRHAHDGGVPALHRPHRRPDSASDDCSRSTASAARRRLDGAGRRRRWPAIAAWGRCASAIRLYLQTPARRLRRGRCSPRRSSFFDERLARRGDRACSSDSSASASGPRAIYDAPDAGPWEFRGMRAGAHVLGGDVLGRLRPAGAHRAPAGPRRPRASTGASVARRHARHASSSAPGTSDAGVRSQPSAATTSTRPALLLPELGLVAGNRPALPARRSTRSAANCSDGDWLYRYRHEDDFGTPQTAFTICAFWYVNALAAAGRVDEAREHVRAPARASQRRSGCCPRTSIRRPASCGAIFRRPTAWSASSTARCA